MKKYLLSIFVFLIGLSILLTGCKKADVLTPDSNSESIKTEQPDATLVTFVESTDTQSKDATESVDNEVITDSQQQAEPSVEENKVVFKSDSDIEFKLNKQENINNKVYNLTFFELNTVLKNNEKVIYKTEQGDTFIYDANSGDLQEVVFDSLATQKNDKSIDKNEAEGIAMTYAKTKYNLDSYKIQSYNESKKGYNFIFSRYIGGYPSVDNFSIKVGYDGNIVYISDNTKVFGNLNLNIEKSFIDAKIIENIDADKAEWDSIIITCYEGQLAAECTITEQHAVAIVPLV